MDQTLDCIIYARRNDVERKRIEECLSCGGDREITVDRHQLNFSVDTRCVTITRASDDVPFACKIGGCSMPYELLERLLKGDYSDMKGFEWL